MRNSRRFKEILQQYSEKNKQNNEIEKRKEQKLKQNYENYLIVKDIMKNNNLGTKKAKEGKIFVHLFVGNDMKNIIEVSNDETSSENISSISENETNSEYGLNDKTSFDKQRSKFGNKNIDISQLLSKSEIKSIFFHF